MLSVILAEFEEEVTEFEEVEEDAAKHPHGNVQ